MPNLAEEDTALSVNSIDDRFPGFNLLFGPYSRSVRVPIARNQYNEKLRELSMPIN